MAQQNVSDTGTDSELPSEWLSEAINASETVPLVLFHYTGQAGILGILGNQELRASHFRYLNDPSEVEYSKGIFLNAIELVKPHVDAQSKVAFDVIIEILEGLHLEFANIFVACFSRDGDNLEQWERYASPFGYSIGFSRQSIEALQIRDLVSPFETRLLQVIYSPTLQRELTEATLLATLAHACRLGVSDWSSASFATWHQEFSKCLALLLSTLKHPGYSSEKEYRIVVVGTANLEPEFRAGIHGIVPYLSLVPNDDSRPVAELVTVAPTHYEREAVAAVAALVGINSPENHPIQVNNSTIPKRT